MDDTEKTKVELIAELKEVRKINSVELMKELVGITNDILISWNTDGIVTFISSQIEKYGYHPDEVISKNIIDFVYPEDRERAIKDMQRTLIHGEEFSAQYRFIGSDGEIYWFEDNSKIQHDKRGDIVGITGLLRDITDRKKVEEKLAEREAFFKDISHSMADWIWEVDENCVYTYCSGKVKDMLDYNPDEIIGRKPFDFMIPEDVVRVKKTFGEIFKKKKPIIDIENWNIGKNKRLVCLLTNGVPIVDENGKLNGYRGVDKNITARKKAEDALQYFQKAVDSSSDAIGMSTPEGKHYYQNETFSKLFGLNVEETEGEGGPPTTIYANEKIGKEVFETIIKGDQWNGEVEMIDKNNKKMSIFLRAYSIKDENNKVIGLVGVHTDITDRKKAEEALRESEERYKLVYDSSVDHIYSYDNDNRYTSANKALCQALGRKQEDIIGKSHAELKFPKKHVEELNNLHNRVKETNGTVRIETTAQRPDGSIRYYELILNPIHDSNGSIIGTSGITREITERKQLEEEQAKASKLESIGILAGGIAHDFNNILAAILGNTSLAKIKLDSNSEEYKLLAETENAIFHATKLTRQLLTFAKGGKPVKETTDLAELIKETTGFSLRGSNVKSHITIAKELSTAEVDKGQIGQVLGNLVINAQQAMPDGGTIIINAKNIKVTSKDRLTLKNGNYIKISIADKGHGIPAKQLSKIFDPYFTTKQLGSGLGLATVYSIIHRHNGHIAVESKVGEGTTFTIYLKASSKKIKKKSVDKDSKVLTGKILVMDDEESIRKVVAAMLKNMGNKFVVAKDGAETIKAYMNAMDVGNSFDVVILDLTIPGGTGGKETLNKLIEIDPDVKAIVSSGYSNDPVVSNYKKHGFSGIISKPYSLEELKKVLNEVLNIKK